MVGTSMPCTETIDGWIPGIDAQPRTPKEEINAPPAVGLHMDSLLRDHPSFVESLASPCPSRPTKREEPLVPFPYGRMLDVLGPHGRPVRGRTSELFHRDIVSLESLG